MTVLLTGCVTSPQPKPSVDQTNLWQPSTNRLVGQIHTVDQALQYVVIDLSRSDPALPPVGAELISRTEDLRPTARLRVAPYQRKHTLGAEIVAGQPSPGDEVVWPNLPMTNDN